MSALNILFLLLITIVLVLLGLLIWRRRSGARSMPDFERQSSLLNSSQRALYQTLSSTVGPHSVVIPRVNLGSLVRYPGDDPQFQEHWKRVLKHWVDFVICSPNSVRPVLAIKLETRNERKLRKLGGFNVLDDTLVSAGIPLLRLRTADNYDSGSVMHEIRWALGKQQRSRDDGLFNTEELPDPRLPIKPADDQGSDIQRSATGEFVTEREMPGAS